MSAGGRNVRSPKVGGKGKDGILTKPKDPRVAYAKMMYIYREKNLESADEQIKKQALLEALFDTQVWNEEYVQ